MPGSKRTSKQNAARKIAEPKATRPHMPAGYGVVGPDKGDGLLSWTDATESLAKAHNYWVVTTWPDARPHATPVWGVWVDGAFYFGTDRGARKARNLSNNPEMVVHLESGDDVVIIEGRAEEISDRSLFARMNDAYFAKYHMRQTDAPGDAVIYRLRPRVAFAWHEQSFNRDATRWTFDAE